MDTLRIALIPGAADVELSQLLQLSAALQKPATRDVLAAWGLSATVDAFASLDHVPVGHWPLLLSVDQTRSLRALLVDGAAQDYAWVEAMEVEELAVPSVPSVPPPLSAGPARESRAAVPAPAPTTPKARPGRQGPGFAEAALGALGMVLISAIGWVVVDGRGAPAPAAAADTATTAAALPAEPPAPPLPAMLAAAAARAAVPAPVASPAPALAPPSSAVDAVVVAEATPPRVDPPHGHPERARHRKAARDPNLPAPASPPSEAPAPPIEARVASAPAAQVPAPIEASAAPAPAPQAPALTASFDALIESRR